MAHGEQRFRGRWHHSEWPHVADAVIEALVYCPDIVLVHEDLDTILWRPMRPYTLKGRG